MAGTAVGNCLTDTTQADFQAGVASSVDLTTNPGNVQLTSSGGGGGATIDQQSTVTTGNGIAFTNASWTGQTFTAGKSGSLTRADINLFCVFCSTAPPSIIVSIRATSGGMPTGSDLASSSVTISNYTGVQANYSANFASPPTVTAGSQYAIIIRASAAYGTSGKNLGFSDSATGNNTGDNVYAGGQLVRSTNGGSSWAAEPSYTPTADGVFATYIGGSGGGYVSAGNLVSSLKDSNPGAGYAPSWNSLAWTSSVPAGTAVKFQAAASNSQTGPFNFVGPDGSAASYFTASNADLSQFNGNRFLKYISYLSTSSGSSTPVLNDATVCYTDTLSNGADLSITNTDGVTAATAGGSVTYTIVASNAGPTNASPATVADTFPSVLTCSWTCAGAGGGSCKTSGSGSINDSVNLPSGGSVTYTATCSISGSATGTVANTATVASASITDTNTSNNSATDTDTIGGQADLSINVSDGSAPVIPGTNVTYTITAANAGPSGVTRAVVSDTFASPLTSCHWTCSGANGGTCQSSGIGNSISDNTVALPVGASVAYSATCSLPTSATGTLSNTASIAPPAGVGDPANGNNSSTETDTITPQVELSITNSDGQTLQTAGLSATYNIQVTNTGPSDAPGSRVVDTFLSSLSCTWTCAGTFGGTCPASGSGNINTSVNLPKEWPHPELHRDMRDCLFGDRHADPNTATGQPGVRRDRHEHGQQFGDRQRFARHPSRRGPDRGRWRGRDQDRQRHQLAS